MPARAAGYSSLATRPLTAVDFDVALVGYGPVGALLTLFLGRYGLRVLALDREATPYALPRAAHLDDEALRILQAVGVLDEALAAHRVLDGMDVVARDGRVLLRTRKASAPDTPYGHPAATLIHQPTVERALRAGGAHIPGVEVRLGHAVTALAQQADGVTLTVDGPTGRYTTRARYVVGCDGARSLVRDVMGAALRGPRFAQRWLVVDTRLTRNVDLPDRLLQIADPARPTTYVPFADPRRRWEFMLAPDEHEEAVTQPASVQRLLAPHVDPETVEIERAAVYTFRAQAARGWRRGRLLLAGDAAHQMPPFLGQGLCAGFRDAHALAWRLALVAKDAAEPALLDQYEAERRPHVEAVTRLAVTAGRLIQLGPGLARLRDGALRAAHASPPLHRRLLDVRGDLSRRRLAVAGTALPRRPLLPQPTVQTADGRTVPLDALLGDGFALVGLGLSPRAWVRPADLGLWARLIARSVRVLADGEAWPESALPGEVAVRDPSGMLTAWAERTDAVVVVRPDRHAFGLYGPREGHRAAEALREALHLREAAPLGNDPAAAA